MTARHGWLSRSAIALAIASLFLAAACGGGDDDDGSPSAPSTGGDSRSSSESLSSAATSAPASDSAKSNGAGLTGGTSSTNAQTLPFDRKIVYNTSLDLSVPDVAGSFNEIQRLVRVGGGYVEKSNLSVRKGEEDKGPQSASLVLRIPVAGFDDLLGSLRGLNGAKVTREEAASNEVTEQYTDLQARLRNLEANEKQYLELLASAKTVNDILTVNDRLSGVREQIETVKGRLNVLDHMTEMATITVALALPATPQVQAPKSDGIATPAEAFEAALGVSKDLARALAAAGAVAAVAMIWLVPVAAIALVSRRFLRGRRVVSPAPPASSPTA